MSDKFSPQGARAADSDREKRAKAAWQDLPISKYPRSYAPAYSINMTSTDEGGEGHYYITPDRNRRQVETYEKKAASTGKTKPQRESLKKTQKDIDAHNVSENIN